MLIYNFKLALKSIRRNPWISFLIVAGLSVGISIAVAGLTMYKNMGYNPMGKKGDSLFYVRLNNWTADYPWSAPNEPPDQICYQDAMVLMESDIPTHKTVSCKVRDFVHPPNKEDKPFQRNARLTYRDFFDMFEVPFRYGGPWTREADRNGEQVIILSEKINDRLFGGENSVGRTLQYSDKYFQVVGVMADWHPLPKFYDPSQGNFSSPETIFMPFSMFPKLGLYTAGNTTGWEDHDTPAELLTTNTMFIQAWVELPTPAMVEDYKTFLDDYAREQKKLGRFPRPLNNKIHTVSEWLEWNNAVSDRDRALLIISALVLGVCILNVIGLILGKFLSRGGDTGVRRALGARRGTIFTQFLVESSLLGGLGAVVSLPLTLGVIRLYHLFFGGQALLFRFEVKMLVYLVLISVLSAVVAGLYPAWRACQIAPSVQLKT